MMEKRWEDLMWPSGFVFESSSMCWPCGDFFFFVHSLPSNHKNDLKTGLGSMLGHLRLQKLPHPPTCLTCTCLVRVVPGHTPGLNSGESLYKIQLSK